MEARVKKLFKYLRPYRMQSILAPLFKLLEAAMELLVPLLMAAIIDTGVGNADKSYILRMSAVVAALGAAGERGNRESFGTVQQVFWGGFMRRG